MLRGEYLCMNPEILSKIWFDGDTLTANWKSEHTMHCQLAPEVKAQSYYLPLTVFLMDSFSFVIPPDFQLPHKSLSIFRSTY